MTYFVFYKVRANKYSKKTGTDLNFKPDVLFEF